MKSSSPVLNLLGRILYSLIFIIASLGHFDLKTIQYAQSQGVSGASVLIPLSGLIILLGGLSVALGIKAKWGAWLIILFLLPVSLMMHNFWAAPDPMIREVQQIMFLKNISMVGAALMITYFGSGPLSFDRWWKEHRPIRRIHTESDLHSPY